MVLALIGLFDVLGLTIDWRAWAEAELKKRKNNLKSKLKKLQFSVLRIRISEAAATNDGLCCDGVILRLLSVRQIWF